MDIYIKMKKDLDYNDLTGEIQSKNPYLVYENGTITKIQNHQKLHESFVYWIGE